MVGVDFDALERSGIDQPTHDGVADLGMRRQLTHRSLPTFDPRQGLFALGRKAGGMHRQ